ncbi:hypothetical protein AVEN_51486-1, partial [Araneus ventricosus]
RRIAVGQGEDQNAPSESRRPGSLDDREDEARKETVDREPAHPRHLRAGEQSEQAALHGERGAALAHQAGRAELPLRFLLW